MTTIIKAKLKGICSICHKEYGIGTRIAKSEKTGQWAHADCIWPTHKDANPKVATSGSAPTSPSLGQDAAPDALESADQYARELLERATQMAHEKTPEWEGMSEYPYLIATLIQVMHGHIINKEIEIQNKEKYKMWGNKV